MKGAKARKTTARRRTTRRPAARHAALRRALVQHRNQLLAQLHGDLATSSRRSVGSGFSDIADKASDALFTELAHGVAELATDDLHRIERAIEKIDRGEYGRCEVCGRHIPPARLRALPFAELCVDCKRQEEGEAEEEAGHRLGQQRWR